MNKNVKYLIIFTGPLLLTYCVKDIVSLISYNEYKDALGALLNISSIVFAIIGAWIAIIFPRAIGRAFQGKVASKELKDATGDTDYLCELVETVMVSAVVLMFVLIIQFVVPLFKGALPSGYLREFKIFGFYIVSILTLAQLWVVFRVILANYFFLNQLRRNDAANNLDQLHK